MGNIHIVQPIRWSPDEQLVPSVLANGPVRMSGLGSPDRCWVVAGLTLAGLTAQDIADRLGCSLRQVRAVRAEDMTQVCLLAQREADVFYKELRLSASELRAVRLEHAAALGELAAARERIARILDAQMIGERPCTRCGAAMDYGNTYIHPATGKRYCRCCKRNNQRRYEDRGGGYRNGVPRVSVDVVIDSQ